MTSLIARLEAATEGSRELDAEIWTSRRPEKFMGCEIVNHVIDGESIHVTTADGVLHLSGYDLPRYTTSRDAALPWEDIHRVERVRAVSKEWWNAYQEGSPEVGKGATEALARRIAALKARSAP